MSVISRFLRTDIYAHVRIRIAFVIIGSLPRRQTRVTNDKRRWNYNLNEPLRPNVGAHAVYGVYCVGYSEFIYYGK